MDISHLLTDSSRNMEASLVRELLHYSQQPEMLSLAGGLPDENLMPNYPDLSMMLDSQQYGASEGETELRELVVSLARDIGIHTTKNNVLITSGSQQGLDIASRLILDGNSTILTEQPTYLAACQVFNLQGANVQGVESDKHGMSIPALRDAIERSKPKAVYLIPNFQNPAGHCYGLKRRQEIAALLDEKNILLIEDDPYRDLCYENVDLTPITSLMRSAPWLYLGSFSKILWPGLRVGYVVSCDAFSPYLVKVKQAIDLHSNRLSQHLITSFVRSDAYPAHLKNLQQEYKVKRDAMAKELKERLGDVVEFTIPSGGMFFWVKLKNGLSAIKVMESALEKNVLVLPSVPFYPTRHPESDAYLRLSFARVSISEMSRAISILSIVIRDQRE
ncbi:PLP-dependent aminotransferase family protein [Marinomonas sp. 5E14-1]|uniref:aminotransferase-like domain-containing protein n=1 Tax=Marinomonas sp. 5E14-1 TaxID=3153922 RepID=UPI0032672EAB